MNDKKHNTVAFRVIFLRTNLNSFFNAFKGPPLALIMFKPVVNLLNGKNLFILTENRTGFDTVTLADDLTLKIFIKRVVINVKKTSGLCFFFFFIL